MKMAGWLMVGAFISGACVCLGVPTAALLVLFATLTSAPMMNLLDQGDSYDDPYDDEDDDGDDGGSDRVPPDEPWWPSGVCNPDDELVGV